MEMLANIGAVPVGSSAMIPLAMVAKVATSAYRVPAVDYRIKGVLTNTMATGAYRGAGRPEGNYLIERLLEKAAREMRIDRVELRRRNLLKPHELPYRTHVGETYDSGEFERMLDAALRAADWNGFAKRKEDARGKLRGRAVSVYLEWTGALPTETVDIEIDAEGTVTVFSARRRWGRDWRRPIRSSSRKCSACGRKRFASCRATLTARMASAASVRAPRSSAAPRWWRLGAAWCSS